jgi:hypothetical protein
MDLQIDTDILYAEVPILSANKMMKLDWDDFGYHMNLYVQGFGPKASAKPPVNTPAEPPKDYWSAVKREVFAMLCTKDRKYAAIRTKIKKMGREQTAFILAAISAWLATVIGAPLAMTTPLVAALLLAIAQVGLNAWCSIHKTVN